MSVAAVTSKDDKKTHYKDYVSFLDSYKHGRKYENDDKGSSSSNSSSKSETNEMPAKSFNEYLENYNNKKYNPVQADFKNGSTNSEERRIVKTEVFIEINNDQDSVSKISKTFDLNIANVKASQKLDKNELSSVLGRKINAIELRQNVQSKPSNGQHKVEKKLDNKIISAEMKRHPLKKTPSITEKSKLFENLMKNDNETKKTKLADRSRQNNNGIRSATNNGLLPPPVPVFNNKVTCEVQKNSNSLPVPDVSAPAHAESVEKVVHNDTATSKNCPETSTPLTVITPTNPTKDNTSCGVPPPPPPPLPPLGNISAKTFKSSCNSKPQANVCNTMPMPKLQNNKQADSTDGLDKNDPRVKKLVYGALREMYGAYHDRANDYLATLPKNRVKKNNGLDKIINSIASQGGLEKLNGRANPKLDAE